MNWNQLNSLEDLEKAIEQSMHSPVLILKHSTRCIVSRFSLQELEKHWKEGDEQKVIPYLLDLLSHRDVSNAIAERFSVHHQSPQVLLIRNGNCIYSETHSDIDYRVIMSELAS